MIDGTDLDHVAIAVERWNDAWPRYVSELGGTWHSGGDNLGFSPAQLAFANGARLEILRPHEPERNDFLRRFLDRSGPGAHHLTFKTPDLVSALDELRSNGYDPVGIELSSPWWKEAFIHPKQAPGIVVQLAQAAGSWTTPVASDANLPPGAKDPAALVHAAHGVADLHQALELFEKLLGGTVGNRGVQDGIEWVDLSWKGPLGLRLLSVTRDTRLPSTSLPASGAGSLSAGQIALNASALTSHASSKECLEAAQLSSWIGDRAGRLAYLGFACAEPESIHGAQPLPGGLPGVDAKAWVVPATSNLGVALVLVTSKGTGR